MSGTTAIVWRIATDTPYYVAEDTSGKGAEITGGRWNRAGTPMLYAASSIALACLETIVHLDGSLSLPLNRYLVRIEVPQKVWAEAISMPPASNIGWDALPTGKVSIDWGDTWCEASRSALALVPSVIVPEELNVLINPRHCDMAKLRMSKIRKWTYDPRACGKLASV